MDTRDHTPNGEDGEDTPESMGPSVLARLVAERTEALQREIAQLRERAAHLQRLYDESALLIGTVALQDEAIYILTGSAALATLLGVARQDLAARAASEFGLAPADQRAWRDACRAAEERDLPQRFEIAYERAGETRYFAGLTGRLAGAAGGAHTFWFTLEETTDARNGDAALAERDRLVDTLIDGAPVGVQIFDRSGASLRVNETQQMLMGLPDFPPGTLVASTPSAGDRPARTLTLERRFFPLADRSGEVRTIVAFTTDVSGRAEAQLGQDEQARRLAQLTEAMTDGLVAFDREGQISYANAAAERLLGVAGAEVAGRRYLLPRWQRLTVEGGIFAPANHPFTRARAANAPVRDIEFVVEQPNGRRLTLSANVAPLRARDGSFDGAVAVISDVTTRRNVEEALRAEAIRDQLTGLYNRRYMEESLRREIHSAERRGSTLTVVMLDLDHFKQFNDAYGHAAGDLLLRTIGAYLQQHIRAGDIACRYGGEELTLIFPDTSIEDTRRRVDELRLQLHDLHVQYRDRDLGGISLSGGIAGMPAHGNTPETLLRVADEALYRAKLAGRDRILIGTL